MEKISRGGFTQPFDGHTPLFLDIVLDMLWKW